MHTVPFLDQNPGDDTEAITSCLGYLVRPYLEVNPNEKAYGLADQSMKKTHPCASNFIQSIFETIQAACINSVLFQTVPSVNDLI